MVVDSTRLNSCIFLVLNVPMSIGCRSINMPHITKSHEQEFQML